MPFQISSVTHSIQLAFLLVLPPFVFLPFLQGCLPHRFACQTVLVLPPFVFLPFLQGCLPRRFACQTVLVLPPFVFLPFLQGCLPRRFAYQTVPVLRISLLLLLRHIDVSSNRLVVEVDVSTFDYHHFFVSSLGYYLHEKDMTGHNMQWDVVYFPGGIVSESIVDDFLHVLAAAAAAPPQHTVHVQYPVAAPPPPQQTVHVQYPVVYQGT